MKAYEFNSKPKQQEYAVSSIGVKEDSIGVKCVIYGPFCDNIADF